MTVASTSIKAGPFDGNDVATTFPFTFSCFAAADLRVVEAVVATGVETDLVLDSGYSVALNADQEVSPGGSITYKVAGVTTALPSTKTLVIISNVDNTQPTHLPDGGSWRPKVVERALDRLTLQVKQITEDLSRAFKVDVTSDSDVDTLLASVNTKAAEAVASAAAADVSADAAATSASNAAASASTAASVVTGITATSITALKALPKTGPGRVFVLGYTTPGDGGGGYYYYDSTDTTSTDNGGTIIVATDGGRWKLSQSFPVSVKQFGAKGDDSTNDTTAINNANSVLTALNKEVYWPAGTYQVTNIPAIAKMKWVGEGSRRVTVKLRNGTNGTLVTSASNNIDDVYITGMRFDGNRANNTSGHVLNIYGSRTRLIDIEVANAPETGIITNWNSASGFREGGCEGFFSTITIDSSGKSGWVHYGPSDSHFENVVIVDSSLSLTNSYYHIYLASGSGNGRFFNLHSYNRSTATVVPASGVYVGSSGNNFSGCHFESGNIPLSVAGSGNTFESCAYYAPRGVYCVHLIGGGNKLSGTMGLTYYSGNPNYRGILLGSANNQIDVVDLGCLNGAVEFSTGDAQNLVKVTGNRSGTGYVGTPAANDDVVLIIGGTAASKLIQRAV